MFVLFSNIVECTNFMYSLKSEKYKGKPFEAMYKILPLLGNPHEKVKYIHIAGSNGKGSTLNFLREMLELAGYQVGAFISPHLERVNERITINGIEISDDQFLSLANQLFRVIDKHLNGQYPSFFELMTLIAFMYFADKEVDISLIESGIGGRFDCTNVITPLVSIITTVSLEHTEILGDTYRKVAYQKAGIIKQGVPIVTGVNNKEALDVICKEVDQKSAPLFVFGEEFRAVPIEINEEHQTFDFQLGEMVLEKVNLKMLGIHQLANASLALTTATILRSGGFLKLTDTILRKALETAKWPGRFERFGDNIIIDGAHNSEGTIALIETLKKTFPNKKYKFIFSVMKDKDYEKSIMLMDEVAYSIYFTEIPISRVAKAKELATCSKHENVTINQNWKRLVENEMDNLPEDELLIITGSLYFIAEVRKFLIEKGRFK